ncbi:hypothetical protein M2273_003780 [Mucilaginibacter lappiensis]
MRRSQGETLAAARGRALVIDLLFLTPHEENSSIYQRNHPKDDRFLLYPI